MRTLLVSMMVSVACCLSASAQMLPDVDSLGNVWIVTIDNSGSMKSDLHDRYVSPSQLAANVRRRLNSDAYLQDVDYKNDRFIFYTSGLFASVDNFGNKMAQLMPLDSSFISHTDAILHKMSDKQQLVKHITGIMASNDYRYKISFVSQIRTFSVVKTVNLLKERGLADDFNTLRLITITDDADQSDNWDKDYKNIRKGDRIARNAGRKPISEVTSDTIAKYVHSDFRESGKGVFKEVYSANDESLPHIWVYEYETLQSRRDTIPSPLHLVTAKDGKEVSFRAAKRRIQGDSVCFFTIDSLVVNGVALACDEHFFGKDSIAVEYKNGLRFNDVRLCGSVQLKYDDEIYGEHYRKLYFVHEAAVPSGIFYVVFLILFIAACILVVGYLAYRFIWLPLSELMRIYDPSGNPIIVKRGFGFMWDNEFVPLADYEASASGLSSVVVRKDRKVSGVSTQIASSGTDLLICSRDRLFLSEQAEEHNSHEDIYNIYYARSADYPPVLKAVYESSSVARLRAKSRGLSWRLLRKPIDLLVNLINFISPTYYYYFKDITACESLCMESFLLPGKKYIISVQQTGAGTVRSVEERIINKALNHYYSTDTMRPCDALLCYDTYGDKIYWSVVVLDDQTSMQPSLRNVHIAYRYVCDFDSAWLENDVKRLLAYSRRFLRHKRICVLDCRTILSAGAVCFKMTSVPLPGFVSVIESVARPKAHLVYSPFADGILPQKYVSFARCKYDGLLYVSFLPYPDVRRSHKQGAQHLMRRLSANIVRTNDHTASYMSFGHNEFTFRDIKVGFDN